MLDLNNFSDLVNETDIAASWQWIIGLPIWPKFVAIVGPSAAFIALIVNFPKAYSLLRGALIRIEVDRFSLVERVPGLVDFQLDLCLHALHQSITIKRIGLTNRQKFYLQFNEPICLYNEPDQNQATNQATVKLAISKIDFEFTQLSETKFEELLYKKLRESQIDILGLQIPEDSFKCLTLAGRLKGKIVDEIIFSAIPLDNWNVLIEFNNRKASANLRSSIIDNNQTTIQL